MIGVETSWHPETKGRKPAYDKEQLLETVIRYAADGFNQAQIAQVMGVHPNTFTKWKKRYTEIDDAIKQGRELLIGAVENALVKRALGYRTEIDKQVVTYQYNGDHEKHTKKTVRHISIERDIAPDLRAIRTLLTYLGKKLERDPQEDNFDRIAYFLEGLREPDSPEEEGPEEETLPVDMPLEERSSPDVERSRDAGMSGCGKQPMEEKPVITGIACDGKDASPDTALSSGSPFEERSSPDVERSRDAGMSGGGKQPMEEKSVITGIACDNKGRKNYP